MSHRIVLVLAFAVTSGCASTTNGAMLKALEPVAAVPVAAECDSTTCKQQWERAQVWIAKHAGWKIQTATDVQLATFNPVGEALSYGFTVIKEPADSGRYRIALTMTCSRMFGCNPKPIDIERAFYHYVVTGKDVLEGLGYLSGIRLP